MNDIEETLKGLYRDLRNQRLLPVIAILIVAIIVVPMALGAGEKEPVPKTELAVGLEPMAETQPVVLPATPELRNFHKRLDKFAKKNPFHQPQPIAVANSGSSTTAATDPTAPTTSTDTSTGTPTDTGGTIPTDTGTTPTDTGTGGTGSTSGTGDSTDPGSTGAQLVSYDIDVEVGAVGEEKEIDGVKSLDLLPGKSHPVLQYVLTDLGGNRADFVVSNAVTRVQGEGKCAPTPSDCQFLELAVGDSAKLDYGPTARTYGIKLLKVTQRLDPLKTLSAAADSVTGPIGFSAESAG